MTGGTERPEGLYLRVGVELCGYTIDHALRLIDHRDGWATYECIRCGAEVMEEAH